MIGKLWHQVSNYLLGCRSLKSCVPLTDRRIGVWPKCVICAFAGVVAHIETTDRDHIDGE